MVSHHLTVSSRVSRLRLGENAHCEQNNGTFPPMRKENCHVTIGIAVFYYRLDCRLSWISFDRGGPLGGRQAFLFRLPGAVRACSDWRRGVSRPAGVKVAVLPGGI